MKELDLGTLSKYNGEEGNPAYLAFQDKVIDVSHSKMWRGGIHMKRHTAGKDLTADMTAAPHGIEVLNRFPQVGILKTGGFERPIPPALARILSRYPMLQRHPHPMLVHFPIAFMFAATLFNLLFLITGNRFMEVTAWYCLGSGILFIPFAGVTGLFTWWLNYQQRPLRQVTIKIRFSLLLFASSLIAFIWRMQIPDIFLRFHGAWFLYFLLVLTFLPFVAVIGWFGGQLTFPIRKD